MARNTIANDAEFQRAWAQWREYDYYLGIHPLKPELRVLYTKLKKEAQAKMDAREQALKP